MESHRKRQLCFQGDQRYKQQRAFISADLEYVNYRSARISATEMNSDAPGLTDYYNIVNEGSKTLTKAISISVWAVN
jgi:hypothetical protein